MINSNKTFDSLLVLKCQSGDKKALEILVKRWHEKLCKHAYWYSDDIEVAKDIVQDSWNIILLKIKYLKDPNSFGSWALTIVTRKSFDWLRKSKKEFENIKLYSKEISVDQSGNDIYNDYEGLIVALKKNITTLPYDQQIVLQLFYIEGYSIKQIGEIIRIPIGTVKSRLFQAREKLKLILKNNNHEK